MNNTTNFFSVLVFVWAAYPYAYMRELKEQQMIWNYHLGVDDGNIIKNGSAENY